MKRDNVYFQSGCFVRGDIEAVQREHLKGQQEEPRGAAFGKGLLRRILDLDVPPSFQRAAYAACKHAIAGDERGALFGLFQRLAQQERDQVGFFLGINARQHTQAP